MIIGVVGIQGAVSEHLDMLKKCNVDSLWIRKAEQLCGVSGLIIPGGESTTISKLMRESSLFDSIVDLGKGGMPIYGTCAGLVLLAKQGCENVKKTEPKLFGLMDMKICRNAFGNQKESFEAEIDFEGIGKYPGVFIRAPIIDKTWGNCKPLSFYDGKIVAAKQSNLLATSFHPELTDDIRLHEFFIDMI
ncbi:MAG: pyridoxal 5'-phosphate synthase glutaminase subunit PdxT [Candidatus Micrarchaeota archaeon]|nr:pyridoxal 5'-phosphate synthase glutaminase subunit PdxT [Candidatus Micrarchaeota archaeon]MBU1886176.1 pyridoxal 5'-phosphate synthase glutaminase subunit PdxT [Candidatus Micrarchaeota archaeon]